MKRGSSGLSLLVAVNKPSGMSSHDVVNRCRRIFGERRVGHTGTLDPLATGVLPICVGPATRLDRYLTAHDKRYRTTICFGAETNTDDACGEVVARADVDPALLKDDFATPYVAGLLGKRMQVPPRYSAIKRDGVKAYERARAGEEVELEPRPIEVYEAVLVTRYERDGRICWVIDFSVSKGTYIRSLARDIGRELGCLAHVAALERVRAGAIDLHECVSLETLESLREQAALDPVRVLGLRIAFADACEKELTNGGKLDPSVLEICEALGRETDACACTNALTTSPEPLLDGELLSVVFDNRLKAIYRFDEHAQVLKPECIFSTGVARG